MQLITDTKVKVLLLLFTLSPFQQCAFRAWGLLNVACSVHLMIAYSYTPCISFYKVLVKIKRLLAPGHCIVCWETFWQTTARCVRQKSAFSLLLCSQCRLQCHRDKHRGVPSNTKVCNHRIYNIMSISSPVPLKVQKLFNCCSTAVGH